jgi:cellulose synthase/poly-beta-1,6-N-acetylglucosamine synthase-like glycosyltransferase
MVIGLAAVLYTIAMLFIFLYSIAQMHLLYHYLKGRKDPRLQPLAALAAKIPVTVQLPVYNEMYVVERLLHAVARFEYPRELLEIQILDDSTDETSDLIRQVIAQYPDVDFRHIQRKDRSGFKAGALREGLKMAKGELIAIFDADFVPDPQFILKTIPHFEQASVGMVQSRWTHLNKDFSLFTRLQAFALDAHFVVEQSGRNAQGAFINFNGTGGIWRKACILDSGNWQDDTLTEDLDLSYRAQQKGWIFVYRPDVESPAELPPMMSAIKSQQFRWTKGGAECARKHLRDVWSKDFSPMLKFHSAAHLLNAVVFPAVICVCLSSIVLWYGVYEGALSSSFFKISSIFLFGFAGVVLVYFIANASLGGFRFKPMFYTLLDLPLFFAVSMGLSVHNTIAVWEGFSGRKSPFIRTPKYNLDKKGLAMTQNVYHLKKLPPSTYLELLLAITFLGLMIMSVRTGLYGFLLLHTLLFFGFGLVSLASMNIFLNKDI